MNKTTQEIAIKLATAGHIDLAQKLLEEHSKIASTTSEENLKGASHSFETIAKAATKAAKLAQQGKVSFSVVQLREILDSIGYVLPWLQLAANITDWDDYDLKIHLEKAGQEVMELYRYMRSKRIDS